MTLLLFLSGFLARGGQPPAAAGLLAGEIDASGSARVAGLRGSGVRGVASRAAPHEAAYDARSCSIRWRTSGSSQETAPWTR